MESLQQKVKEAPELKGEIKPLAYQGLELMEATNYKGGTSIKYWM